MKISNVEVDRVRQTHPLPDASERGIYGPGRDADVVGISPAASVEVSAGAQEIQRVRKLVAETPDIRDDVVQSIKARIDSGSYKINSDDVADQMVRRALADRVR